MKATAHLSHTETAKLIRQTLKAKFAGVKFSVRSESFSGGTSVDVKWTDGPTEKAVERAISKIIKNSLSRFITCERAYSVEFVRECAIKEAKSMRVEAPEIRHNPRLSVPEIVTDDRAVAHYIWERAKNTNA